MNISLTFKKLVATKHKTGFRVSLATISLIEVVIGIALFACAIGFDVWVYRTKVAQSTNVAAEDVRGVTELNTRKLLEAYDSIKGNNDFILRPTFPLIRSPF
jgi:hypothetical protein